MCDYSVSVNILSPVLKTAILESAEGVSNRRNDFMVNLCCVAKMGIELATPGSAIRRATDCAREKYKVKISRKWHN